MSTPILPFDVWPPGSNQASIPANDNALRSEILAGLVISKTTTAQPSGVDGAIYIIPSGATGARWATFTAGDLAIFRSGTWYAYAPVDGVVVHMDGSIQQWDGSDWVELSGSGGVSGDFLSPLVNDEIAVSGTYTLEIGRMHSCSGSSSNYTITLPPVSGNAGKFVGVRMSSSLSRLVTLKGNSSELIDGENERVMWRNESAVLMCDGVAWSKISGKTVPVYASMRRSSSYSMSNASFIAIPMDTVVSDNTSFLPAPIASTSTGRVTVFRKGNYSVSGLCSINDSATGTVFSAGPVKNATDLSTGPSGVTSVITGVEGIQISGSCTFAAVAGDYMALFAFQNSGSSRNTRSDLVGLMPTLTVSEIPSW